MIAITIGYILDLLIGDPYWLFHPIRWIGSAVRKLEKILLKNTDDTNIQKFKGVLLLVLISGFSYIIPSVVLMLSLKISKVLKILIESFMIFQIFATKCLDVETKKVFKALLKDDIKEARLYISYLVSRDTSEMSRTDIIKAAIETISENLADGVIAPIMFVVIGGAPLGLFYKSVNTLDSMVGYKNDKYLSFGWASAKFDDVLNYIPSRLTAFFILISGLILKLNVKNGYRILLRDRRNHASPNSAYPESAAAGILGIQIGGRASYFGVTSNKPTMGDSLKEIELEDLKKMSHILYLTSFNGIVILLILRMLVEVMV